MSGLEVLGAVAAAAQLVDYGVALSAKAVQVYRNSPGTTDELQIMREMTLKFNDMNQSSIMGHQKGHLGSSPTESAYAETARQSSEAASELLRILGELQVQGEKSKMRSLRVAWKADWRKATVEKSQRRLELLREQLNDQLVRMINDRQSLLARGMSRIEQNQRTQGKTIVQGFEKLKTDLLSAIESRNHGVISSTLIDVQTEGERVLLIQDILASLRFDEMHSRFSRIAAPNLSTCEWIFDSKLHGDQCVRFTEWLENDNGIFWVTGKAGSGKSTMMKHIATHPLSKQGLERWSNGRKLFTASHWFWYLGTPMQKSYDGLLQSILYDVLRQCPSLIEYVCEARWQDEAIGRDRRNTPWTLSELRSSIDRLAGSRLDADGAGLCFCFFIDGLDEYAGDHEEVVRLLSRLAEADNIKVCASSRPWEVFQQSFVESTEKQNVVILHQHTKDDIARVVHQELDPFVAKRKDEEEEMKSLVSDVIRKSQGVFLWVNLVIKKELLPGFRYADSISLLRQRLDKVPQELEDYFEQIFNRIPSFYRRDTGRIFKTCLRAGEPLPIHVVQLIISEHPWSLLPTIHAVDGEWARESLVEDVRKQVNGRCQDLLEVVAPEHEQKENADAPDVDNTSQRLHHIDFLHRSVKDYLQSGKLASILDDWTDSEFDAASMLLACYSYLVSKTVASTSSATNRFSGQQNDWRRDCLPWSTCALLHAADAPLNALTQSTVDKLNEAMGWGLGRSLHWTNDAVAKGRDLGQNIGEHGQRDFLGHLIELGVVSHALLKIQENPTCIQEKDGRPYLDYALRYQERAPYRKARISLLGAERFPIPALVKALLSQGCDVNEKVWIYDGRTVWSLFLAFLCDMNLNTEDAKEVTWLLIDHGAEQVLQCEVAEQLEQSTAKYRNVIAKRKVLSMQQILESVFGQDDAAAMCQAVAKNAKKGWISSLKFW